MKAWNVCEGEDIKGKEGPTQEPGLMEAQKTRISCLRGPGLSCWSEVGWDLDDMVHMGEMVEWAICTNLQIAAESIAGGQARKMPKMDSSKG